MYPFPLFPLGPRPRYPNHLQEQHQRHLQRRVEAAFAVDYNHIPAPSGERHHRQQAAALADAAPTIRIRCRSFPAGAWKYKEVRNDVKLRDIKALLAVGKGQVLMVRVKTPFGEHKFEVSGDCMERRLEELVGWVDGFAVKQT